MSLARSSSLDRVRLMRTTLMPFLAICTHTLHFTCSSRHGATWRQCIGCCSPVGTQVPYLTYYLLCILYIFLYILYLYVSCKAPQALVRGVRYTRIYYHYYYYYQQVRLGEVRLGISVLPHYKTFLKSQKSGLIMGGSYKGRIKQQCYIVEKKKSVKNYSVL